MIMTMPMDYGYGGKRRSFLPCLSVSCHDTELQMWLVPHGCMNLNGGNLEMQLEANVGSKLPLSPSLLYVRKTEIEREKERDC